MAKGKVNFLNFHEFVSDGTRHCLECGADIFDSEHFIDDFSDKVVGRQLCSHCRAELTQTDREAGFCTQCKAKLAK